MGDIEIRTVRDEELAAWSEVISRTFFGVEGSGEEAAAFRRSRLLPGDAERLLGAFDGGRPVGTFRSLPLELTLPGGSALTVAAVTNVAVLATHRRHRILTRMMTHDLRADADRGEAAAILIASEYPIYGRYGYGVATEHATWTIARAGSAYAQALDPIDARVETITTADASATFPAIYERYRLEQPGEISRREKRWLLDLGIESGPGHTAKPGWLVMHRDRSGTPDGYLRFRVEDHYDDRIPAAILSVDELIATNATAEAALWRHAFDIDMVSTIKAGDRRVDEAFVWRLVDARAARMTVRADFLWLRPLDVPRLLETRSYTGSGCLVVEVTDADGFASGRFELDATPAGARCVRTDRGADVRLPAASLGSLLLGGVRLSLLGAAGRADVLDGSVLGVADALFRWPVAPFCSTWF